jgi:hypothetical protein
MSSDLINLFIEEYEQYKITNCDQAEKNIKEFYKLIQQDLEIKCINIVYSYQYWSDSIYLECVYVDKLDGRIKNIIYLTRYLNKYKLINDLYIYDEGMPESLNIMSKEMYKKIITSHDLSILISNTFALL